MSEVACDPSLLVGRSGLNAGAKEFVPTGTTALTTESIGYGSEGKDDDGKKHKPSRSYRDNGRRPSLPTSTGLKGRRNDNAAVEPATALASQRSTRSSRKSGRKAVVATSRTLAVDTCELDNKQPPPPSKYIRSKELNPKVDNKPRTNNSKRTSASKCHKDEVLRTRNDEVLPSPHVVVVAESMFSESDFPSVIGSCSSSSKLEESSARPVSTSIVPIDYSGIAQKLALKDEISISSEHQQPSQILQLQRQGWYVAGSTDEDHHPTALLHHENEVQCINYRYNARKEEDVGDDELISAGVKVDSYDERGLVVGLAHVPPPPPPAAAAPPPPPVVFSCSVSAAAVSKWKSRWMAIAKEQVRRIEIQREELEQHRQQSATATAAAAGGSRRQEGRGYDATKLWHQVLGMQPSQMQVLNDTLSRYSTNTVVPAIVPVRSYPYNSEGRNDQQQDGGRTTNYQSSTTTTTTITSNTNATSSELPSRSVKPIIDLVAMIPLWRDAILSRKHNTVNDMLAAGFPWDVHILEKDGSGDDVCVCDDHNDAAADSGSSSNKKMPERHNDGGGSNSSCSKPGSGLGTSGCRTSTTSSSIVEEDTDRYTGEGGGRGEGEGDGMTALHLAAKRGFDCCLQTILRYISVTDIDVRDRRTKMTALHYACEAGSLACSRLLLLHGADPECRDKLGETALHKAAESGVVEVVSLLCEKCGGRGGSGGSGKRKGASSSSSSSATKMKINARNKKRETPLMLTRSRAVAVVLIASGADPLCCGTDGLDAACRAARRGDSRLLETLLKCNSSRRQNAPGAAVSTDRFGVMIVPPPSSFIISEGSHANATAAAAAGAGASSGGDGPGPITTPLHEAAAMGKVSCVRILLNDPYRACDVIKFNRPGGITPLMAACMHGYSAVVEEILRLGAAAKSLSDVLDAEDSRGANALSLAIRHGHTSCVNVILKFSPLTVVNTNSVGETVLETSLRILYQETTSSISASGTATTGATSSTTSTTATASGSNHHSCDPPCPFVNPNSPLLLDTIHLQIENSLPCIAEAILAGAPISDRFLKRLCSQETLSTVQALSITISYDNSNAAYSFKGVGVGSSASASKAVPVAALKNTAGDKPPPFLRRRPNIHIDLSIPSLSYTIAAPDPFYTDVVIRLAEGEVRFAHAFILARDSEVLAAMLNSELGEKDTATGSYILRFPHYSAALFDAALKWMYTRSDISVSIDHPHSLCDLLFLANELLIYDFQVILEHEIGRRRGLFDTKTLSAIVDMLHLPHLEYYLSLNTGSKGSSITTTNINTTSSSNAMVASQNTESNIAAVTTSNSNSSGISSINGDVIIQSNVPDTVSIEETAVLVLSDATQQSSTPITATRTATATRAAIDIVEGTTGTAGEEEMWSAYLASLCEQNKEECESESGRNEVVVTPPIALIGPATSAATTAASAPATVSISVVVATAPSAEKKTKSALFHPQQAFQPLSSYFAVAWAEVIVSRSFRVRSINRAKKDAPVASSYVDIYNQRGGPHAATVALDEAEEAAALTSTLTSLRAAYFTENETTVSATSETIRGSSGAELLVLSVCELCLSSVRISSTGNMIGVASQAANSGAVLADILARETGQFLSMSSSSSSYSRINGGSRSYDISESSESSEDISDISIRLWRRLLLLSPPPLKNAAVRAQLLLAASRQELRTITGANKKTDVNTHTSSIGQGVIVPVVRYYDVLLLPTESCMDVNEARANGIFVHRAVIAAASGKLSGLLRFTAAQRDSSYTSNSNSTSTTADSNSSSDHRSSATAGGDVYYEEVILEGIDRSSLNDLVWYMYTGMLPATRSPTIIPPGDGLFERKQEEERQGEYQQGEDQQGEYQQGEEDGPVYRLLRLLWIADEFIMPELVTLIEHRLLKCLTLSNAQAIFAAAQSLGLRKLSVAAAVCCLCSSCANNKKVGEDRQHDHHYTATTTTSSSNTINNQSHRSGGGISNRSSIRSRGGSSVWCHSIDSRPAAAPGVEYSEEVYGNKFTEDDDQAYDNQELSGEKVTAILLSLMARS